MLQRRRFASAGPRIPSGAAILLAAGAGLGGIGVITPLRGAGPPLDQAPAFRSSGTTVSVHATVSDDSHRLVTTLEAGDFTVFDNDVPQPLTVFERKALPISVALLLDTSESMRKSIGLLRDAAKEFVAHLLPGDRVELGAFNQTIRWVRPFTSDREKLNLALGYLGTKWVDYGTALWPAMDQGLKELSAVDGRKVLLVFSDGEHNLGRDVSRTLASKALVDNVMVYAITLQTEYCIRGTCAKSVLDPRLPGIAAETGGGYFELTKTDDLAATFARVADELHHQYTLGFEAPALDGKSHTIAVQVKGQGLKARARRSYLAVRPR